MKGYQLTFFTQQNRRHRHMPLADWLLRTGKDQGAAGGTLVTGAEGFDHAGTFHSGGFFELADQPVAVTLSLDEKACCSLFDILKQEDLNLAYVKVPVEFGHIGRQAAPE